ncbi:MAG: MBL fold metallo-hydrolase [Candidatus Wolframiiraptor sp.]|nr:MAG: MBL fold metallo-hydrolase [Candidatus Wolframiiraptor sp.]
MPFRFDDVEISWLGHAAFLITHEDTRYYLDPFKIKPKGAADAVLITHEHFDHLSIEDLRKIVKPETEIVAPESCKENLRAFGMGIVRLVKPGESLEVKNAKIETIPAYNINKFRAPGVVYHPIEQGGVGYIIEVGGIRIYHAGDTDFIPEMRNLEVDVALVPVSGTFVMTAEEAADAVNTFKPKVAIPMHFGSIVGSRSDAETFKKLAEVDVVILEKE